MAPKNSNNGFDKYKMWLIECLDGLKEGLKELRDEARDDNKEVKEELIAFIDRMETKINENINDLNKDVKNLRISIEKLKLQQVTQKVKLSAWHVLAAAVPSLLLIVFYLIFRGK